ncbi:DUF4153 domain-containing protein [Hymenobacter sp. BT186]|uniref:DUF4153 domain-containing protein n=1 Tax=Hymenobacter telluris TaxID=2816474 RepID=A0A939EU88_9BACT|nr:DUF4153 domain-containing protein [Hymenobacter telluris]MBO0356587.1 DUF4153 domain-containing protein [Hymenobacter telluris]MBW3372612.1 DUF4153 domain-containing protein [Hymenobacter norwichensis]
MQLPSLSRVAVEAARVVRRFPLTLLCALVLCVTGIHAIRNEKDAYDWLFPLLSAGGLGLTLTLSVALAGERYQWPRWVRLLVQVGAVALVGVWYWLCPLEPNQTWGLRLVLLLLGLHLLVAVVPYLPELRRRADTSGFWRYNETLFLRILTAGIYSGVLYVGCALALTAINNLFDVKLDNHLYGYLFVVLATVFNTWFFLAGVPHDFKALEQDAPYPKALKLFTQFVLLPLVVLYLAILYAYLTRILVLQTLPKGWVSLLVLALSVAGIFALLLIHPVRDDADNTWIRTFARWFYRALFPLLGLLAVAIGTRIRAYGITEERYFVLVLAAWLAIMATYFLLRQGRGIIWIPASLALIAFLAAAGPWSAFAVAERSQLNQLRELAAQYNLLQNGKLDGVGKRLPKLSKRVKQRVASVFGFFAERDAMQRLQPFFAASLAKPDSMRTKKEWEQRSWMDDRLYEVSGIPRWNRYDSGEENEVAATFQTPRLKYEALGGGRYWLPGVDLYRYDTIANVLTEVSAQEGTFRLRAANHGYDIWLEQLRADSTWQRQLSVSPGTIADSLIRKHGRDPEDVVELPTERLTLRTAIPGATLQVYLRELTRREEHDTIFYSFEGNALLELHPQPK